MNVSFKEAMQQIGFHGAILLRGFAKVVYGAAVAGLVGLAAYGFYMIPSEDGYVAVCDFIGSIMTLSVALICMYGFGQKRKKGARF